MRYYALGSYLFFIQNRFSLTCASETEQWSPFYGNEFQSYPTAKVFCFGEMLVWNDRVI